MVLGTAMSSFCDSIQTTYFMNFHFPYHKMKKLKEAQSQT